jgi:hypothetical protein
LEGIGMYLNCSLSFGFGKAQSPPSYGRSESRYNERIMGKYNDEFRDKFKDDLDVATSKRKQSEANLKAVNIGQSEFFKELAEATNNAVTDIRETDNFLQFVTPGLRSTAPAFSVVYNRDHEERTANVTLKSNTHEVLLKSSGSKEEKFKIDNRDGKLQLVSQDGTQAHTTEEFIRIIFSTLLQRDANDSLKVWEKLA